MIADCVVWWKNSAEDVFGLDIICVFSFVFFLGKCIYSTSVILNMGPGQAIIKEPTSISLLHLGMVSDVVAFFLS